MQSNDINKWIETHKNIVWIEGNPWVNKEGVLEPLHMPHIESNFDRIKIREALKRNNALFAYWTDQWTRSESEWWWTICDNTEYDIENIENPRGRRGVRKGLKECSIKQLTPDNFIDLTYDIFAGSIKSYGHNNIPSKSEYRDDILKKSKYEGYDLWGAFVNNQIAAFATCVILDGAVILGSTKSDPELHKYAPNNALFYYITKYYLHEKKVKYVSNGARTMLHTTSINDFLLRMGFRRNYCRLNIELSYKAKILYLVGATGILRSFIILKKIFPGKYSKFEAFIKLVQISKTFK